MSKTFAYQMSCNSLYESRRVAKFLGGLNILIFGFLNIKNKTILQNWGMWKSGSILSIGKNTNENRSSLRNRFYLNFLIFFQITFFIFLYSLHPENDIFFCHIFGHVGLLTTSFKNCSKVYTWYELFILNISLNG